LYLIVSLFLRLCIKKNFITITLSLSVFRGNGLDFISWTSNRQGLLVLREAFLFNFGGIASGMNFSEIAGSLGVAILLLAFLLNMLKIIKTESLPYLLLNFIGAGIACFASWLIPYFPFVILEGVWAFVSLVSLLRFFYR